MKKILLFISLISFAITQAQIVNIPDTNFKNVLLIANSNLYIAFDINNNRVAIDTNNDGEIQITETENIYKLQIGTRNISNLTGIEEFTNITELKCGSNTLTNLDLSNNINLINLECNNNQLSSLNISNNINLVNLNCSSNQLTNLDINNNINLTNVNCLINQLSSLNTSNNINLINLNCQINQLNSLNIGNNTNLSSLSCYYNQLMNLDITNNILLTYLNCDNNSLSNLNLSNNPNLTSIRCSNNQLSSLDVTNIIDLTSINCENNQISILDLSNNPNLTSIRCSNNQLSSLDVTNKIDLISIDCDNNQISILDLSNDTALNHFSFNNNQLTNLDLSNNTNLTDIQVSNNLITNLDLSSNQLLVEFLCENMPTLEYLNLKNGNNTDMFVFVNNTPNLNNICIDDINNTDFTNAIITSAGHSVTFTEYCSLSPTISNQISGNLKLDLDNNGCDNLASPIPNLMLLSNNGTESFATFTQNNGNYILYTNDGDFTTSVSTNLPNYLTINPNEQTNTFTGFDNTFTADFCVEPNQTINDINISLIPISKARPGFKTTYQIVYNNVGTTQLNGNVTLEFDETKLSFLNSSETANSQASNSLTFNYSNLTPFETRTIDLEFNVFTPPTVEIDDVLNFTTTINPITGDFTTDDNIFTLNQTVVGSFDPNDIKVLEGNQILLADADKYLHYVIRFQNTGTASAINVVVTNDLDANLDWSTLQLESLSHNNRVVIKNGNEIEFIFENINLPDGTTDEPNSHGFIAYKIKPKTDIALDEIILNKADIFFDYNSPIETNTATTTIVNTLAVNENTLLNFSVYPTPTESILNVKSKTEIIKIEIYSKLGQLIIKNTTESQIDISNLTQGLYFVKVEDENGNFGVKKFLKR